MYDFAWIHKVTIRRFVVKKKNCHAVVQKMYYRRKHETNFTHGLLKPLDHHLWSDPSLHEASFARTHFPNPRLLLVLYYLNTEKYVKSGQISIVTYKMTKACWRVSNNGGEISWIELSRNSRTSLKTWPKEIHEYLAYFMNKSGRNKEGRMLGTILSRREEATKADSVL